MEVIWKTGLGAMVVTGITLVSGAATAAPIWSVPLVGSPTGADRIIVEGHGRGRDFVPAAARVPEKSAAEPLSPLAIDAPLLPDFLPNTFGREERATFEIAAGRLIFRCRPGDAPAGLVFSGYRPQGAAVKLLISNSGFAGATIGLSAPDHEPHALQDLIAGVIEIPLGGVAGEGAIRLTLLCPLPGGETTIEDMRLTPADPDRRVDMRSAWAWDTALWRERPEFLVARAAELRVSRLFVSLDIDAEKGVLEAERFAAFVGKAHAASIAIVVVEGDAGMALPPGRRLALGRLAQIMRYQQEVAPAARIDGLQYDIEPYLLPEFLTDPDAVMSGWADTIHALRSATMLDLEMVLPFWLCLHAGARDRFLPALKKAASGIAIMAYRTDRQQIIAAAMPLLAWAGEAGLRTRVALENGPVTDEVTQTFFPGKTGRLVVEADAEGRLRATLLDRPAPAGKPAYAFSHETVAPASAVSFLGRTERFLTAIDTAESAFKAWPAFSGMALHGVIE